MVENQQPKPDRLKQAGEVLGLLTGIAVLVYLVGAAIMALRLYASGLPWDVVVAHLPREILISVGLTTVVLPCGLISLLFAASLLASGAPEVQRPVRRLSVARFVKAIRSSPAGRKVGRRLRGAWMRLHGPTTLPLLVGLSALGIAVIALHWTGEGLGQVSVLAVVIGAAVFLAVVTLLRAAVTRRFADRLRSPTAISLFALLMGATFIPAVVALGAGAPLPEAQACAEGPTHFSGVLIGEAQDRVYIGEDVGSRIVSIPTATLQELYVGPDATTEFLCRAERSQKPTIDELAEVLEPNDGQVTEVHVSGRQPRFAMVLNQHEEGDEAVLFRRAGASWKVVFRLPRVSDRFCEHLERATGIDDGVLAEFGVCTSKPR